MRIIYGICVLVISLQTNAQDWSWGNLNGNTQLNYQTFQEDKTIGAEERTPYTFGYQNLIYNYKKFTIGMRSELYINPIPSFSNYEGKGISNLFFQFKTNKIEYTFGSFYDEFGSGLIFKSYFDSNLGVDNSVNGMRLKFNPIQGIYITGLIGQQRSYWGTPNDTLNSSYNNNQHWFQPFGRSPSFPGLGDGIIRAFNADIILNDILLKNWKSYINVGFSFVTKKEEDNDPIYILPENVGAFNGRMNISKGNVNMNFDYAYKINDPSTDNNYIYKNGNAFIFTSNYSKKGLGISLGLKRIENMSFRSERNAILQDLNINYITPFTKQQAYSLASIYPYSSQPNGEMGSQIDVYYKIPKKYFGGKYGMDININFSNVFNINKTATEDTSSINESGTLGYNSNIFKLGDDKLFQEFNLEISKKINRNVKIIGTYINLINNDKILKSQPILNNSEHEIINANIVILESIIRIPSKGKLRPSLRTEIQHLTTKQHFGNWAMGLIEFKLSKFFMSFQDLYNYGHPDQPHYYSISGGYSKGAKRFSLTYGKQRAGLFCVGGVCRKVPASNGVSISLTNSF